MSKYRQSNQQYSFEEKKLAVETFFAKRDQGLNISLREFSRCCGINYWTIRLWMQKIDWQPERVDELKLVRRQPAMKCASSNLSEAVQKRILEVKAHYPSWGPLKIKQYLFRHEQILVPQSSIYRLLKSHGLVDARPTTAEAEPHSRRFEYAYPLAAVQMDLLNVAMSDGRRLYLVTLLDDFSRFVLDARFVPVKTMDAVIEVFKDTIKRYGVMDKLLTDCGSEFVSWQRFTRFEDLLVDLDVEYIASGPDKKENQGKVERWHQTVRTALRERGPLDYASEAQPWIRALVDIYNYERPHQALGGLLPADRFFGLKEEIEAELERHRCGERRGQKIYLACRIGARRMVLSGPDGTDLSLYIDGVKALASDGLTGPGSPCGTSATADGNQSPSDGRLKENGPMPCLAEEHERDA